MCFFILWHTKIVIKLKIESWEPNFHPRITPCLPPPVNKKQFSLPILSKLSAVPFFIYLYIIYIRAQNP